MAEPIIRTYITIYDRVSMRNGLPGSTKMVDLVTPSASVFYNFQRYGYETYNTFHLAQGSLFCATLVFTLPLHRELQNLPNSIIYEQQLD